MTPTDPPAPGARGRHVVAWAALIGLLALVTGGLLAVSLANSPAQRVVTIAVIPHPDDEFQLWSLVEGTPDEYKIFVSMTNGEETGFCEPDVLDASLQTELGELPPLPTPTGRWGIECEQARSASLLGYLEQMSETDPSIPGDFGPRQEFAPLPGDGTSICRVDDGAESCNDANREVSVWTDRHDRGAVVFFDLGDGDVTSDEVTWALRSLIERRAELGLEGDERIASLIGAFANDSQPCFSYPHPDHVAVHEALWSTDFGVGPQLGATCFLDGRQRLTTFVDRSSVDAAFEQAVDGTRIGAHGRHYGWLHATAYPIANTMQSALFMRVQSFWVRFN
ncbi:hypothetical protein [Agromyces italicus]|uniref:hypothetical protein n=1 Tax=Agromyces italicus TaxID=279572 RepID=UPI0003B743A1|nr:hypothetical protein [Agromyces italicus]